MKDPVSNPNRLSRLSERALVEKYTITRSTVRKWKFRDRGARCCCPRPTCWLNPIVSSISRPMKHPVGEPKSKAAIGVAASAMGFQYD